MANNFTGKDASLATQTFKSTDNASVHTPHVNVDSNALPTGASTAANQTTIIGHVDGIEALLTTVDADTSNISTKIDTLAGAVAGTEMQVDVLTMPTVAVTGTFYQATQPVSAASLPLPTGASTLAEQQTQTTALQLIDDTVYSDGTGTVVKMLAVGGTDGTNPQALKTDSAGELQVDVLTLPSNASVNVAQINGVTPLMGAGATGTGSPRVTAASDSPEVTALQIMDDWDNAASDGASVSGDVAHDSGDAGEPVKIGFKAYNQDGTVPGTAVTEADRVNGIADLYGRQYVSVDHPYYFRAAENHSTAQTNNELVAAPGAGLSLYITDVIISNGATAGDVKLVEDSAGTPVDVIENIYLAINGGAVMQFKTPLKLTANKNLGFTSTTVTTHSLIVSGYIAP